MGFELTEKRSMWEMLMSPGPIITGIGLLILLISIFFFSNAGPESGDVDAILQAQSNTGQRLKSMIGLVVGIVTAVFGVLLTLLKFYKS